MRVARFSSVVAELRDAHLFGPFPLIITSQPVGQTNVIGSPAITLSVGVEGSNPYYQWYADGNAVPSGNSASYTVMTGKTNAGVNYSVIATNILGRVTSSVARVLILTDTLPIKLLSVVGPSGPLNNQSVASFGKTLLTATSTNLANYS